MKRKIYITCLHLNHGGVEMAISLLANALISRNYEVEILCTYHFGTPVYPLNHNVKITYLTNVLPNRETFYSALHSKNPLQILSEGFRALKTLYLKKHCLIKAISKIDDGIIISTRNEDTLILSKYGQPTVKKIAQLHHDHKFDKHLIKDFQTRYSNIDYFILLTDSLRDEISTWMKPYNSKTRCITIPNFINLNKTDTSAITKDKQVVAVGRLHTDKGFDRLIKTWDVVHQTHPDWKLKIIGDGPLEKELHSYSKSLSLTDSIIFTGALDHQSTMMEMKSSSIYAMTSISEAFPFVLLEAMQNYLPIVAYDVRVGPRALVQDGKNGFLIPDDNYIAFASSICKLIESPELLHTFQKNSFSFVHSFSEDSVMRKWLAILN